MKVFRIDLDCGEYYTLTEKEMKEEFTQDEIIAIHYSENDIIFETTYTVRQLNRARKLHKDDNYCWKFEQEFGIAPSVYDILKHLYGEEK